MSHLSIDITTHLLLALYPIAVIFFIEIIGRHIIAMSYKRYIIQGITSFVFAIAYIVIIEGTGIAIILFILTPVLFVHAKRVKQNPTIR